MPALPPGPAIPRALQTLKWIWKPFPFMRSCARAYGDAFTIRLLGFAPLVFCSHPSAIREIFTGDSETLLAGRSNEFLKPVFGPNSILLLDGARTAVSVNCSCHHFTVSGCVSTPTSCGRLWTTRSRIGRWDGYFQSTSTCSRSPSILFPSRVRLVRGRKVVPASSASG